MIDGFNKMCVDHHKKMRAKGFWETEDFIDSLDISDEERLSLEDIALTTKLALIGTEVSEAVDAVRARHYGVGVKDTFESELADILFRLMDLIGGLGIDIESSMNFIADNNAKRPNKHGKAF